MTLRPPDERARPGFAPRPDRAFSESDASARAHPESACPDPLLPFEVEPEPRGVTTDAGLAAAVQRRTLRTLVASQMLGGIGVASAVSVASLFAEQLGGSPKLAGLAQTTQVFGAAVTAFLMARVMAVRGRRAGLVAGYGIGALGALLAVLAGWAASLPLLLVATSLVGAATAANSQARFAGTDLAPPDHHGRALSFVVWATTVGAVLGPNLAGVAGESAQALGLPPLAGPFLFSFAAFAVAIGVLASWLRPDPLLLARRLAADAGGQPHPRASLRRAASAVAQRPRALVGLAALALGHTVMIAVMVMTPLHMHHGGAALDVIGFVISVHILGMYALSPLVGWVADRAGRLPVVGLGSLILLSAVALAGRAPEGPSTGLTAGLFLLGLGWSCCLVAGSTLLTAAVPLAERPGVQGFADLVMGSTAAVGGALAGVVVGGPGYGALNAGAAVLAALVGIAALLPAGRAGVVRS